MELAYAQLSRLQQVTNEACKQPSSQIARLANDSSVALFSQYKYVIEIISGIINESTLTLKRKLAFHEWEQKQYVAGGNFTGYDSRFLDTLLNETDTVIEMVHVFLNLRGQIIYLLKSWDNYIGGETYIQTMKKLEEQFVNHFNLYLNKTLVIAVHPIQVIKKSEKTKTNVSAVLRLLKILRLLDKNDIQPKIEAFIIDESQARSFVLDGKVPAQNEDRSNVTFTLDKNETTNEPIYFDESGGLIAHLTNMKLPVIRRKQKEPSRQSVVEEKLAIMFCVTFRLTSGLITTSRTLSAPITVIVHGNQEQIAQGVIKWDNVFSKTIRLPFETPQYVTWEEFANFLSNKSEIDTGKKLSSKDINYLRLKVEAIQQSRGENEHKLIDDRGRISRYIVSEYISNRRDQRFTFLKWFEESLKFINKHLNGPWKDGLIDGFISKELAVELLQDKEVGTFILRLSDSILGGICIVVKSQDPKTGMLEVLMLSPYSSKDLDEISLADRICNASKLKYVYPNVSKSAITKYRTTTGSPSDFVNPSYVPRPDHDSILGNVSNWQRNRSDVSPPSRSNTSQRAPQFDSLISSQFLYNDWILGNSPNDRHQSGLEVSQSSERRVSQWPQTPSPSNLVPIPIEPIDSDELPPWVENILKEMPEVSQPNGTNTSPSTLQSNPPSNLVPIQGTNYGSFPESSPNESNYPGLEVNPLPQPSYSWWTYQEYSICDAVSTIQINNTQKSDHNLLPGNFSNQYNYPGSVVNPPNEPSTALWTLETHPPHDANPTLDDDNYLWMV